MSLQYATIYVFEWFGWICHRCHIFQTNPSSPFCLVDVVRPSNDLHLWLLRLFLWNHPGVNQEIPLLWSIPNIFRHSMKFPMFAHPYSPWSYLEGQNLTSKVDLKWSDFSAFSTAESFRGLVIGRSYLRGCGKKKHGPMRAPIAWCRRRMTLAHVVALRWHPWETNQFCPVEKLQFIV